MRAGLWFGWASDGIRVSVRFVNDAPLISAMSANPPAVRVRVRIRLV